VEEVMGSDLRNKLKEFFWLLSSNSLPVRIHRPCPLCNKPMSKSHLVKFPRIPNPVPNTSTSGIVIHYWSWWVTVNHLLHNSVPPIDSKHLITDPRDLELHRVTTYWPKYETKWWSGTIDEVSLDTREFHVTYTKPWASAAWMPFDSYEWYIKYPPDDISAWNLSAPHIAKSTSEKEWLCHNKKRPLLPPQT
jgi:hypothetical protein